MLRCDDESVMATAPQPIGGPLRKQIQELVQPPLPQAHHRFGECVRPHNGGIGGNPTQHYDKVPAGPACYPIRVARSTSSIVVSPRQTLAAPASNMLSVPCWRAACSISF